MTDHRQQILRYFELAPTPDDAYFEQFARDAVVEDEGVEHHGIAEIRAWRTEVLPVTYAVQDIKESEDGELATAEIKGDFPGSPIVLAFLFRITADGHISALAIRP